MNPTLPPLPEPCYSALIQGPHGSEFRRLADQYDPHAARYSAEQMNERYLAGYSAALAQQVGGYTFDQWWAREQATAHTHAEGDEWLSLDDCDKDQYRHCWEAAQRAAPQPSTEPWPQCNPWAAAIDEALVVNCLDCTTPDSDPTTELARLVAHEVDMALDPAVSKRASVLRNTHFQDAARYRWILSDPEEACELLSAYEGDGLSAAIDAAMKGGA